MSGETEVERHDVRDDGRRPPRAVVGSHRVEEEMFGKVFDPKIVRRIWAFVRPYRREIQISVVAVLIFTLTQLAIPLIIRYAIDIGLAEGAPAAALYLCGRGLRGGDRRQLRREPRAGAVGRQGGRERAVRHPRGDVRPSAARLAVASWTRPRSAG